VCRPSGRSLIPAARILTLGSPCSPPSSVRMTEMIPQPQGSGEGKRPFLNRSSHRCPGGGGHPHKMRRHFPPKGSRPLRLRPSVRFPSGSRFPYVAMRGTTSHPVRCVALRGVVHGAARPRRRGCATRQPSNNPSRTNEGLMGFEKRCAVFVLTIHVIHRPPTLPPASRAAPGAGQPGAL